MIDDRVRAVLSADVIAVGDGGGKVNAGVNPILGNQAVSRLLIGLTRKLWGSMRLQAATVNGLPGIAGLTNENALQAIVGFDFYHGAKPPGADPKSSTSRKLHELGILTMPYLCNLAAITKPRVTLIALPLKIKHGFGCAAPVPTRRFHPVCCRRDLNAGP